MHADEPQGLVLRQHHDEEEHLRKVVMGQKIWIVLHKKLTWKVLKSCLMCAFESTLLEEVHVSASWGISEEIKLLLELSYRRKYWNNFANVLQVIRINKKDSGP